MSSTIAARKSSITGASASEVAGLKKRIQELEQQVAEYKRRLDGLRKAKNTTILKTQKEVVEVNTPNLGQRTNDTKIAELQRKLDEQRKQRDAEMAELRKKHDEEKAELKSTADSQPPADCGHESIIESLQNNILSLEDMNTAVLVENSELKERVEGLVKQLSLKEAEWCDNEEKLKQKIRLQWGEKYREWIEKTEHKIEELQQTNTLLRGYLKDHQPKP